MKSIVSRLSVALVALLLMAVPLAVQAAPEEQPPEAKPVLGVVLMQTEQLRAENNPKPMDMIRGAVNGKLSAKQNVVLANLAEADFVAYLGKKDIMPDSTGLLREVKLPVLLEYAKNNKLDYLFVVFGDAKVARHMKTNFSHFKDDDGKIISTHTYENEQIDYADVTLRVAYVDVKKGEYVSNLTITKRSDSPGWGNPVRSVINDGSTRAVNEFNQKITL